MGLKGIVLALFVAFAPGCVLNVPQAIPIPYPSIAPYNDSSGGCTAFSINGTKNYWLTASHCLRGEGKTIGGMAAILIAVEEATEIGVLQTPTLSAPAIPLSPRAPKVGDEAVIIGFAKGINPPPAFFANISIESIKFEARKAEVTLYHEGGGPGASGAPILNRAGEVIGMLLGGDSIPSHLTYSPTHAQLRKFAQRYWE